jgi:hypothetical protein
MPKIQSSRIIIAQILELFLSVLELLEEKEPLSKRKSDFFNSKNDPKLSRSELCSAVKP